MGALTPFFGENLAFFEATSDFFSRSGLLSIFVDLLEDSFRILGSLAESLPGTVPVLLVLSSSGATIAFIGDTSSFVLEGAEGAVSSIELVTKPSPSRPAVSISAK